MEVITDNNANDNDVTDKNSYHALFIREAKELRRYLRQNKIGSVLLGLSGGPDSVLTLHLLMQAAESLPDFRIGIAHANFHLRKDESMRDEMFVRRLIERYPGIEPHFISFDTLTYCRGKGCSVEMGARALRHEWFDNLCASHNYARIATGHNSGDNEETLLLNLLRGSGSRGLRGMEYDNGRVIRPLLQLSRREVIKMLQALPEDRRTDPLFVTDSSNETVDYRRNFLRHRVIPLIETRWDGARSGMQTTLRLMAEENKIVEEAVRSVISGIGDTLPWRVIADFPSPLTLIHHWIAPHGGTPERAAEMASALSDDGHPRTGGRWQLRDAEITATAAGLRLSDLSATKFPIISENGEPPACSVDNFRLTPENKDQILADVRKPSLTSAWLPGKPEDYIWRHPAKGDRMAIGPKASKLVSDILREKGVTAALRPKIWILVSRRGDRPLWIPGIRRAFDYRISSRESEICRYVI